MSSYCFNFGDNKVAEIAFTEWTKHETLISFSFGKGIIGLFASGAWDWTEVTRRLDNKLRGRQRTLPSPTLVATNCGNSYYILFADGNCEYISSRSFTRALTKAVSKVSNVAFAPHGGWYILFEDGTSEWSGLPEELECLLEKQQRCSKIVREISIAPGGYWFISYCDGTWDANLPPLCRREFDSLVKKGSPRIDHVWLGRKGMFLIAYSFPNILTSLPLETTTLKNGIPSTSSLPPSDISLSKTSTSSYFENNNSQVQTICGLEKKQQGKGNNDLHTFYQPWRFFSSKENSQSAHFQTTISKNGIPSTSSLPPPDISFSKNSTPSYFENQIICGLKKKQRGKRNDDAHTFSQPWRLFSSEENSQSARFQSLGVCWAQHEINSIPARKKKISSEENSQSARFQSLDVCWAQHEIGSIPLKKKKKYLFKDIISSTEVKQRTQHFEVDWTFTQIKKEFPKNKVYPIPTNKVYPIIG